MRSAIFFILFFCMAFVLKAQDLSGTWEGSIGGREYAKLCIIRYKDSYVGYTYDEGSGFCKAHFTGNFNTGTQKLKGLNPSFIDRTPNHVLSRYNLDYTKIEDHEYLIGTISDKSAAGFLLSLGAGSGITYTRTSKNTDTTAFMRNWLAATEPAANPQPPVAKTEPAPPVKNDTATIKFISPPAAVTVKADTIKKTNPPNNPVENIITASNKRITDTLSVIDIHETQLTIKVMDNGIVDGDTVSIIHNGQVIAERLSVTTKPFEITIPVNSQNDRHEIVLVAHNLGSIPPNTALIVIETPEHQYRITASTDLGKNAMIIFRYKE